MGVIRAIRWGFSAMILVLAAASLWTGCSGPKLAVSPPADTQPVIGEVSSQAEQAGIPDPGTLELRSTAATGPVTYLAGDEYYVWSHINNVNEDTFLPQNHPYYKWNPSDCASAIYRFNLNGVDPEPVLNLDLSYSTRGAVGEPRKIPAVFWLGLANWDEQRWDWYPEQSYSSYYLDSLAPYTDEDGNLAMLAFVTGFGYSIKVNSIRIGLNHPPAHQWKAHTLPGSDNAFNFQLALDSAGDPWVCHRSYGSPDVTVAQLENDEWVTTALTLSDYYSEIFGLRVDRYDWPEIFYTSRNESYFESSIYLSKFTGDEWMETRLLHNTDPQFAPILCSNTGDKSLALTYGGLYYYVLKEDLTGWICEELPRNNGYYKDLAIDSTDGLVFCAGGSDRFSVLRRNGEEWVMDWELTTGAYNPRLALDGAGRAHVIIFDDLYEFMSSTARHARFDGNQVVVAPIDPAEPETVGMVIRPGANGYPVLAYIDYSAMETVAGFWTGTHWHLETVVPWVYGEGLDIAMAPDGRVWVGANWNKQAVVFCREME